MGVSKCHFCTGVSKCHFSVWVWVSKCHFLYEVSRKFVKFHLPLPIFKWHSPNHILGRSHLKFHKVFQIEWMNENLVCRMKMALISLKMAHFHPNFAQKQSKHGLIRILSKYGSVYGLGAKIRTESVKYGRNGQSGICQRTIRSHQKLNI